MCHAWGYTFILGTYIFILLTLRIAVIREETERQTDRQRERERERERERGEENIIYTLYLKLFKD